MKDKLLLTFLLSGLLVVMFVAGCNSSSAPPPPPPNVTVSISAPTGQVQAGGNVTLTATAAGDPLTVTVPSNYGYVLVSPA